MRKVALFSLLLVAGLGLSQLVPADAETLRKWVMLGTMAALSFIMIHVGYEFELDKTKLRALGWDYVVAFTAAAFPWIMVALYFVFVMSPRADWGDGGVWRDMLLQSRFASPTSAGVLFSMLAAAGLAATWLFRKARVLAILDDLDTILLMIPLQVMMVGMRPQLGGIVIISGLLLWAAWKFLHRVSIPVTWPWVMGYAVAITTISELAYMGSKAYDPAVPVHLEVLLPAFVLGCIMKRPTWSNPHGNDAKEGELEGPETRDEQLVATIVSAVFMVLVGLSMPSIFGSIGSGGSGGGAEGADSAPAMGWGMIAVHVLAVTAISNLGKMFPALCYRREATLRGRLALSIGMWPRGEVGAGVLAISLGYGIGGATLTVAVLSLSLNLLLTGVFILAVRRLLRPVPLAATLDAGVGAGAATPGREAGAADVREAEHRDGRERAARERSSTW